MPSLCCSFLICHLVPSGNDLGKRCVHFSDTALLKMWQKKLLFSLKILKNQIQSAISSQNMPYLAFLDAALIF